jgi:hypothetical protein
VVVFMASNALSGADTTIVTVTDVDRPPVVTVEVNVTVAEQESLTVVVTAADPDGQAITSLTAVQLPAGASFTAGPGNTSGTLAWRPSYTQAGSYAVVFTASNALSGVDSTLITVTNVDRGPVVTVTHAVTVTEHESLTVVVAATDPDGDAIDSLTVGGLPVGATFTPGPGNTSGTLVWVPDAGSAGLHTVTFTATNALAGMDSTVITVNGATTSVAEPDRPFHPGVGPNPVRGHGSLRFVVEREGDVRVQVFDVTGRAVRNLLDERDARAGEYELRIDAGPAGLSPGMYFYRIQAAGRVTRGRFIVLQ